MNYKLEKFWNYNGYFEDISEVFMNYKLEKFWNDSLEFNVFNNVNNEL